jgi:hypothetical protein
MDVLQASVGSYTRHTMARPEMVCIRKLLNVPPASIGAYIRYATVRPKDTFAVGAILLGVEPGAARRRNPGS